MWSELAALVQSGSSELLPQPGGFDRADVLAVKVWDAVCEAMKS
jgi:hypothetical protein